MQALERLHAELGDQIVEDKEEAKRLAVLEAAWATKVAWVRKKSQVLRVAMSCGHCSAHWCSWGLGCPLLQRRRMEIFPSRAERWFTPSVFIATCGVTPAQVAVCILSSRVKYNEQA